MNDHGPSNALARVDSTSGSMTATQGGDGSRSLTRTSAHTVALAARQEAEIKARYAFALANPRDIDDVRLKLTKRCGASRFAAVARYKKPQGKKKNEETGQWEQNYAEGFSIRFVEEAIRTMGNILPEDRVTSEDADKITVYVSVTDLESNISYGSEIIIPRTVERKELKRGQVALSMRTNSFGDPVYILPATEDEVRMSKARLVSMTLRTLGLRLIPGDVLDECLEVVLETQRRDVQTDPEEARKKLIHAFDQIGVKPDDLRSYLGGRALDALTPDLIIELRAIYTMVKEEGTPWRQVLAASPHIETVDEDGDTKNPAADKLRAKIEGKTTELVEKDKARRATWEATTEIAKAVGVDPKQVQAVVALVKAGKSIADIARYSREATGIEDEVLVGEIVARARKAGLLPPESSPGKGSEPPAAPTPPQNAPVGAEGGHTAERGTTTRQRRPTPAAKRAVIAEQEGVTPETVAAVEELSSGGDDDVAISAALRVKGLPADPPTVAAILSALKK